MIQPHSVTENPDENRSLVKGISILEFSEESIARKAGMKKGDVIVEYNGTGDLTTAGLSALVAMTNREGVLIRVVFVRRGREESVELGPGPLGISAMDTHLCRKINHSLEKNFSDAPLFTVTYRGYKVFLRGTLYFLCICITGPATILMPLDNVMGFNLPLARLLFGFLFMVYVFLLADMLLLKEIRLYRNKLVRVSRLGGTREVRLKNARLRGMKFPPFSMKKMCPRTMNRLSTLMYGVTYDEYLMDRQKVKELNMILADLSGRNVKEFERIKIEMEPFI